MTMEELVSSTADQWLQLGITYSKNLVAAILVLVIGFWVVKVLDRLLTRLMEQRDFDIALRGFLQSLFGITLKILVLITAMTTLGVEMTSFIALLGAAGLAVGMALSGTLQNFAGGVILLILKPFRIGDFIEAMGHTGTVHRIAIFNTILKTPDNKTIVVPNGGLANGTLVNFSTEENRRVEWTFGIAYGDDADLARTVLLQMLKNDERVKSNPEPVVLLAELGNSSVNFKARAWVHVTDFWPVFFAINEQIYKEFGQHGLHIPFPQMDVHLRHAK